MPSEPGPLAGVGLRGVLEGQREDGELGFDTRLRDLLALVFTYGQGTPAPVEEPADFPYSLAREVGVAGAGADPRFPGGAETERDFEQGLAAEEQVRRARRNAERGESGPTPGNTST